MVIIVPRFRKENGFITDPKRSRLMAKIKGVNSKPEIVLRKELWERGVRYRKNVRKLAGCPDVVIGKLRIVIFIDGEFWHGNNWVEKKKKIKANRDFWIPKIERNMERDKNNNQLLEEQGFKVIRFWAKEVLQDLDGCIKRILKEI